MKSEIKFKEILYNKAKLREITLTDEMLDKFEKYKNLLLEWNKKINLTAITDDYEIIMKHFIDCLECVKYIKTGSNAIDVGTGAGFPGIVFAIFFEGSIKITLLDALNKRLLFLQDVTQKLQLKNIEIVHGRAEEMAHKKIFREQYDIAVSRAVAPLNVLLEYDTPYIKLNGVCLLLKGDNVEEEIKTAKTALDILGCKIQNNYKYTYNVENEIYNRSILEVKKIKNTPKMYPRNNGKIKNMPL